MSENFDQRIIDAVRATGPNAYPSKICEWIETTPGAQGSLASVIGRLTRLSGQGILRENWVIDDKGRDRRAYSMGTGTLRRRETMRTTRPGGLATAG